MRVVYTAPNRAHHYRYAMFLQEAGVLKKFVNGFPRISPRSGSHMLGKSLHRVDFLQTLYMGSLKFRFPTFISENLAYLAKIEQDWACKAFVTDADIFLFYNGSGLSSCRHIQQRGGVGIVEAVNSHVSYQEQLLHEEHQQLGLPWRPFHAAEKERRIAEYKQADYVLLPSEFVKQSFIELGFPAEKLLKVPYGFESLTKQPKPQSVVSEDFTILYVGTLSVRKGLRYLIQAFKNFRHPRKKLVVVGPTAHPSGIDDLSIPSEVTFTGVLKGEALQHAYQTADVFCLPSIEEGLALVLGEALSFGIPIITTTNSGASDIFTDGDEGYIVPIRDAKAIEDRLQYLADHPYILAQMRAKATRKAEELKGWDETGQRLIETLNSLSVPRKLVLH